MPIAMRFFAKTVIDLFCGCGGMSWGLEKAGFQTLAGIDTCAISLATFQKNHPHAAAINADIGALAPARLMEDLNLAPGQLSCLVGGPPCQGFSKNVPRSLRFLQDPRNQLFQDYLDFVRAFLPKTVIMENVAEIYNAFGGAVRCQIIASLQDMGYRVKAKVLYAGDFGIPQRRRRCFFFASRTDVLPEFPEHFLPPHWAAASAWDAISDLPRLKSGEGADESAYSSPPQNGYQELMRESARVLYDHRAKNLRQTQFERLSALKPGEGHKQLPTHLQTKSSYSGAYGRLDKKMIAPTLTRWVFHPGSGRYGHPTDARILTIREAARIQSFSEDFRFCGTYVQKAGQLGNAVPPLIMYSLADKISACLSDPSERAAIPQETLVLAPVQR